MKPLLKKYVLSVLLFLFCFSGVLTAAPALAADEDIYMLFAIFAGADMGNEERAPTITIIVESGEVDLWVVEDSLFIASGEAVTLAQFAEQFIGQQVMIEFIAYGDEYFLVECTLILTM